MDTIQIEALGYAVALVVYTLLTILLLRLWRRSDHARLPAIAIAVSAIWAGIWVASYLELLPALALVTLAEWTRGLIWLIATIALLSEIGQTRLLRRLLSAYGAFVLALSCIPVAYLLLQPGEPRLPTVWIAGGYVLSILIILTAEQVYRSSPLEQRQSVSYLFIAIAGMFVFDLLIYVSVIAGAMHGPGFLAARGFINAIFAAPLALGIWRRYRTMPDEQAPRQMVFYSFGITMISIYIAIVLLGHNIAENFGGSWSAVSGILIIVAALALALTLLASANTRARVRVLLMKTFFQYKYDYRKEWLRFIGTLSESGLDNVAATAVRAVAQIVNSPGGVVWIREQGSSSYAPMGSWNCAIPDVSPVSADCDLATFLKDRQWVIDLEELKRAPQQYENLQLDAWLQNGGDWWLVVPLFLGKRLYGFIVLRKPGAVPSLNFEDHDLLRTVGRHVGSHISQAESDRRMVEIGQFGAYNRLTAFLMHDLNNLIAQQSLVVENAEKFRENPKFVDDAIDTIAHSVARMKRLMEQLTSRSKAPTSRLTDLHESLTKAVERCQILQPGPMLTHGDERMPVKADPERLITVFEHLIRNAQDATEASGKVSVEARITGSSVSVSIADSGVGMSREFIRERLFRPFDSTKGSGSMGIGAYQARDYVRSLGGQLEVTSREGAGTTFVVRLPLEQ